MTLSILIPVFNSNASALVNGMLRVARVEEVDTEVIICNDASTVATEWLRDITSLPDVRVLHNAENQGRARTRNIMAEAARGEWLLMVDADAALLPQFSLRRYLEAGAQAPVVCGGLCTPPTVHGPQYSLRYRYERNADLSRSAAQRQQNPYRQLSTFSLLVRRDVFLSIRFDDTITAYGYEDALFGMELMHRNVSIRHIDNPLLHTGIDTNEEFLHKTEEAMLNLTNIAQHLRGNSRVVDTAARCQSLHLTPLIRAIFNLTRPALRRNLLSASPSLRLFNLYKLGLYTTGKH